MDKLNCTSGQGKPLSKRHLLEACAAVIWAGSAGCTVGTRGLESWLNPFVVGDGTSPLLPMYELTLGSLLCQRCSWGLCVAVSSHCL